MVWRFIVGVFRLLWHTVRFCFRILRRLLRSRLGLACLILVGLYFGIRGCEAPALRVGTYNIREFGVQTDLMRLRALLAETNADILALQEIQNTDMLGQVATDLSTVTSRSYQAVVSRCGGKRTMHLGFLYDTDRVQLDDTREFPELRDDDRGSCSQGDRAGLLGVFSVRSGLRRIRTYLLTVHFPAGSDFRQAQARQDFWARALGIVSRLRAGGEKRVLLLGDVNSTGYRDDAYGERTAIHRSVEQAGFRLLTPGLACTEYWRPSVFSSYLPSHLDHLASTRELQTVGEPTVQGHCAALRCQPTAQMPSDYNDVSDHCPVLVTLR